MSTQQYLIFLPSFCQPFFPRFLHISHLLFIPLKLKYRINSIMTVYVFHNSILIHASDFKTKHSQDTKINVLLLIIKYFFTRFLH